MYNRDSKIACFTNAGSGIKEKVINQFCYISSTFTVPNTTIEIYVSFFSIVEWRKYLNLHYTIWDQCNIFLAIQCISIFIFLLGWYMMYIFNAVIFSAWSWTLRPCRGPGDSSLLLSMGANCALLPGKSSSVLSQTYQKLFAFYCLDLSIPRQIYKYLLQESCNKTSMRPDLLSGLLVLRSPLDV